MDPAASPRRPLRFDGRQARRIRWAAHAELLPHGDASAHPGEALTGVQELVVVRVRRRALGTTPVAGAVGSEPSNPPVVDPLDRPTVLVEEPVMEPADEEQVAELGGASA